LYKKEASRLESFLQKKGYKCCAIHGDKSQDQRTKALAEFKSGQNPVLIATDVAARGLDIPNVEYVINVSFPLTIEDYIHRIGRTGRAGKFGIAHTFFTSFDKARSGELINVLREAKMPVPDNLMKFGTTVKKKAHATYGDFGPKADLIGLVAKKTSFSDSDEE
jgi:ATP-dependent RNA helicase DBP3